MMLKQIYRVVFVCNVVMMASLSGKAIITHETATQLGDALTSFAIAKMLSVKYDVPFYSNYVIHADLFVFNSVEKRLSEFSFNRERVYIKTEEDIINNKDRDVILYADIGSRIDYVGHKELDELKKVIQLKEIPLVKALPASCVTVAVHIRKGNGGGVHYDGEQGSLQEFDFDRSLVRYRTDYENFSFDCDYLERRNGFIVGIHGSPVPHDPYLAQILPVDQVENWQTKFPPNQFYIDQIIKLSDELPGKVLHVTICTDDREPELLLATIQQAVNRKHIQFMYENDRHYSYHDRVWRDLYLLSRCDVLIRGQSYFSRVAELMGNHKMIIYPLNSRWEDNKLIMHEVVIKKR
jgi:hypothetical protein